MRLAVHIDRLVLDPTLGLTRPERDALSGAVARELAARLGQLPDAGRGAVPAGPPGVARPLRPARQARVDRLGAEVADAVHAAIGPLPADGARPQGRPLPAARPGGAPR